MAYGSGSYVRANGRCATLTGQGGRMLKVDKMMRYLPASGWASMEVALFGGYSRLYIEFANVY